MVYTPDGFVRENDDWICHVVDGCYGFLLQCRTTEATALSAYFLTPPRAILVPFGTRRVAGIAVRIAFWKQCLVSLTVADAQAIEQLVRNGLMPLDALINSATAAGALYQAGCWYQAQHTRTSNL